MLAFDRFGSPPPSGCGPSRDDVHCGARWKPPEADRRAGTRQTIGITGQTERRDGGLGEILGPSYNGYSELNAFLTKRRSTYFLSITG
jgi:hypothetical protein